MINKLLSYLSITGYAMLIGYIGISHFYGMVFPDSGITVLDKVRIIKKRDESNLLNDLVSTANVPNLIAGNRDGVDLELTG
jgi:hypothetical protein